MRDGDPFNGLVFEIALGAMGVYCLWYAFKSWRDGRVVRDTPTSRVRSAAQGYVELDGRGMLAAGVQTRGPLTRLPCTWWTYRIEEADSSRRGRTWRTLERGTSDSLFFLEDGTGRCLIDPRGAQVFTEEKTVWYGSTREPDIRIPDGTSIIDRIVDRLTRGNFRYTEHRMSVGAPLYAIGAFRSVGGVSGGAGSVDVDAATLQLLRDWKRNQQALLQRFDTNGDGVLSSGEWEVARTQAREQVQRLALERPAAPMVNMLSQPDDGRSFLLAACDADRLTRRFGMRTLGGLAGFLAALTALTAMLQSH